MTYRNGRFINNVFVPHDAAVPKETVISSEGEKKARSAKMISNFEVIEKLKFTLFGFSSGQLWNHLVLEYFLLLNIIRLRVVDSTLDSMNTTSEEEDQLLVTHWLWRAGLLSR